MLLGEELCQGNKKTQKLDKNFIMTGQRQQIWDKVQTKTGKDGQIPDKD